MGYLVEAYRESDDKIMKKLHEAKMAICEAMNALEEEEMEYNERRNYRGMMSRRDHKGRYDY